MREIIDGSGNGAFGGSGVSEGRIVSGVSFSGLDGKSDFRCNWCHGFPFLNRRFFTGCRPAAAAAARTTRPGPQPVSKTAMPGRRSRRSMIVAARLVLVNGLSNSTSHLKHTGHGRECRCDATRHKKANSIRRIAIPSVMYITFVSDG